MSGKTNFRFRLGIVGLVSLAFALLTAGSAMAAMKKLPIRLGVGYSVGQTPSYVAIVKGYFADEGLDAKVTRLELGSEVVQAIVGGSIDGGFAGTFPMLIGASKGAPLVAVAPYAAGGNRYALVARNGSGINSVNDMYGKKVAFATASSGEEMFFSIMEVENLDPKKITIVRMQAQDLPSAIATKSIDAFLAWEPYPSLVEGQKTGKVVVRGQKYVGGYSDLFFHRDFVKNNRETMRRYLKAIFRAQQFTRQHEDEAFEIALGYFRTRNRSLRKAYKFHIFDGRLGKNAVAAHDFDIKFLKGLGKMKKPVTSDQVLALELNRAVTAEVPQYFSDLKRTP
jgi:ABC-type nitrate/sulfonate/bicarbonate transport system substrate-binding protein